MEFVGGGYMGNDMSKLTQALMRREYMEKIFQNEEFLSLCTFGC